jgi:hypothetical protein
MRILQKTKDGGPDSSVDAYFLIELKGWFSIALLKFNAGQRKAFHTHAFNAWTWFIKGDLLEFTYPSMDYRRYKRSWLPKVTKKSHNHRVRAKVDSWAFTIRGPWDETWTEDENGVTTTFTHGRKKL